MCCRQLQKQFLIIDHFVPAEERSRLINLAQFDEDLDDWVIRKEKKKPLPRERLLAHKYRRPITDHALDREEIRYKVNCLFYAGNLVIALFLG